ncbi:hypothetical protein ACHAWF_013955 [Thalassiosira exigua]
MGLGAHPGGASRERACRLLPPKRPLRNRPSQKRAGDDGGADAAVRLRPVLAGVLADVGVRRRPETSPDAASGLLRSRTAVADRSDDASPGCQSDASEELCGDDAALVRIRRRRRPPERQSAQIRGPLVRLGLDEVPRDALLQRRGDGSQGDPGAAVAGGDAPRGRGRSVVRRLGRRPREHGGGVPGVLRHRRRLREREHRREPAAGNAVREDRHGAGGHIVDQRVHLGGTAVRDPKFAGGGGALDRGVENIEEEQRRRDGRAHDVHVVSGGGGAVRGDGGEVRGHRGAEERSFDVRCGGMLPRMSTSCNTTRRTKWKNAGYLQTIERCPDWEIVTRYAYAAMRPLIESLRLVD